MTPMSPEQELQRATRARQILDDDLFREAVAAIEQALLRGIQQSAFSDDKLREKLCQRYSLLQDLLGQFRTHIESGMLAEEQIRQRTVSERMQAAWGNLRGNP